MVVFLGIGYLALKAIEYAWNNWLWLRYSVLGVFALAIVVAIILRIAEFVTNILKKHNEVRLEEIKGSRNNQGLSNSKATTSNSSSSHRVAKPLLPKTSGRLVTTPSGENTQGTP